MSNPFDDNKNSDPRERRQCPPDDLDDKALADVLALRRFLLSNRCTFLPGAPSTAVALDLERLGLVKLRRFRHRWLKLMEVTR